MMVPIEVQNEQLAKDISMMATSVITDTTIETENAHRTHTALRNALRVLEIHYLYGDNAHIISERDLNSAREEN